MNHCRNICILAICSLTSLTAFGQVCTTQSHGLQFIQSDPSVDQATNLVLSECQQNPVTNNADCASNLHCDYDLPSPYPSGRLVCVTSSHNIAFQGHGAPSTINAMVNGLISQCTQDPVTNNADCSQNLACGDSSQVNLPYGMSGDLSCETSSAGLRFKMDGEANAINEAASGVLTQCQQNPITNNADCASNLSCHARWNGDDHHGDDHDFVTCHTDSHSIDFSQSGPRSQLDQLTSQVINQCEQNPVTINTDCTQNLTCH